MEEIEKTEEVMMKKSLCAALSVIILMSIIISAVIPAAAESDDAPLTVPQVRIVTDDNVGLSLKKETGYVDATVTITDTDGSVLSGEAQVKVRGNSTAGPLKKPYTVKFSSKKDVLGMGKAKKWALLANMYDPTMLRNYVGIHTAAELELAYTSQQQIVEVWMDGEYRGCYNLIEPVQEGKTRVDIDIESDGGKKDFLIERERTRVEADATYFTTHGIRFVCDEPEEPNDEQLAYIQSTMDSIIATMKTGSRAAIEAAIDLDSFAEYYLLNEFVKTVDFDFSSVFFYYKDGKLYAGPAWDYDLSLGNEDILISENYAESNKTDGLHCDKVHLYQWLCGHDWFFSAVRRVYQNNKAYFDSIGVDGGLIDSLYSEHKTAIDRNFNVAGWHTYAYYPGFNKRPSSVYADNLRYFKSWCNARIAWLDEYFTENIAAFTRGDTDGDSLVSIIDATAIQRSLASESVSAFDSAAADADCDSAITIVDATAIQRYLAELDGFYTGEIAFKKSK